MPYEKLGDAYRKMGEFDKAVQTFADALKLDPHNPETNYWMGYVYLENLKNSSKAWPYFQRAMKYSSPGDWPYDRAAQILNR